MQTHDKRQGLIQWLFATTLEILDHIKTGVHCRLKTTDSCNEAIRQKRINFYIEKEE